MATNTRVREIVQIDEDKCTGCGLCVPNCAEGAIKIVDGKARLVADNLCDGLGACIGHCPEGAITIIKRNAEDFSEEAVTEHEHHVEEEKKARARKAHEEHLRAHMAGGCPGARVMDLEDKPAAPKASGARERTQSALSHWPVQIRLIPPQAPFLQNADLLVVADCVPVAYPDLHREFLPGKAVMIGCPKFDDAEAYVEKFKEIFRTANIKSVTVLDMEVPCCSALPVIVKKGMQQAQKTIPMEVVTISAQGRILKQQNMAA